MENHCKTKPLRSKCGYRTAGFLAVCVVLLVSQTVRAKLISGSVRHAETNAPLSGFVVKSTDNKEATVADNGTFNIDILSEDPVLRVLSDNDVLFARAKLSENNGVFRIQPTGVIYDATTGEPAAGVKINLVRDTPSKSLITNLETNQQGQVTDKHGLYRFDLINYDGAADVLLQVSTTGTTYQFPSTAMPPPEVCPLNSDESQVLNSVSPDSTSASAYCLGFSAPAGNSTLPIHNHIPG